MPLQPSHIVSQTRAFPERGRRLPQDSTLGDHGHGPRLLNSCGRSSPADDRRSDAPKERIHLGESIDSGKAAEKPDKVAATPRARGDALKREKGGRSLKTGPLPVPEDPERFTCAASPATVCREHSSRSL